jgi:hypothetical protein
MRNIKGWMIVAVAAISVMLVGAGGATAASFITSKDIKNGTIKMADISSSAKRALKGNAGSQGSQGVQGPAGGFDPAKVVYVEGPMVTAPAGEAAVSVAYCPAGTKAISGGYFFAYANDGLTIETNQPLTDGTGWMAGFANSGGIDGDATAYAVCAAK